LENAAAAVFVTFVVAANKTVVEAAVTVSPAPESIAPLARVEEFEEVTTDEVVLIMLWMLRSIPWDDD